MEKMLKLKILYQLKMLNEEYFEGFEKKISVEMPHNLKELQNQVLNCHLCNLSKTRNKVVFGEGSPTAKMMFIGEAPGREEDIQGRPFVGASGKMISDMIKNVFKMKREEIYIANIIKCRPPQNRNPEESEVASCIGYLFKQIEIIQPKLILTFGRIAFQYLLDDNTPISKARGKLYNYKGIKVIPTYHPSYLLRMPSKKRETLQDLNFAKEFL